jgi:hypothetical protein
MKPTREGYWFYKNEPVKVIHVNVRKEKRELYVLNFDQDNDIFVDGTEDSDWGPEILPQCEHEVKMCIHPALKEPKLCMGKLWTKKEITRPNPDESANGGNDASG